MQVMLAQSPVLSHYLSQKLVSVITRAEARYLQQFPDAFLAAWGMCRSPVYNSAKLLPPSVPGVYLTAYFSAGSVHVALSNFTKNTWSAPLTPESIETLGRSSPPSFPYDVSNLYWRGLTQDLYKQPLPDIGNL